MEANEWFAKYIETLDSRLESVETKLDDLLSFKWQILGGTAAFSLVVGIVIQFLVAKLG